MERRRRSPERGWPARSAERSGLSPRQRQLRSETARLLDEASRGASRGTTELRTRRVLQREAVHGSRRRLPVSPRLPTQHPFSATPAALLITPLGFWFPDGAQRVRDRVAPHN